MLPIPTSLTHHTNLPSFSQLQGYNAQKASFSRTIHIKQIGHALFTIPAYNESYLIPLPSLHIEGLIYGKPFVELNNCTYISSSSGYVAKIDYSGKGWVSGKKNSFTAVLYPQGKERDVLYTVEGQWSESFTIKAGSGHGLKKAEPIETYNAKTTKTTPLTVAPIEEQDPLESNRAWQTVAAAIMKSDMDTVHVEKSKIENSQRELRRKEAAEGREWQRRFFKRSSQASDPLFDQLAKFIPGERIEAEKTGGVWRFDESKKAERAGVGMGMPSGQAAPVAPLQQQPLAPAQP
ncbi:hypothetical protein N7G274_001784 [Stereocaulon virgatum]|uniref:Oxysterol-binding protein n=1 Tax=Stereocaulon virgatum TaxID=373712 RepID=A0ABR4ANQ3_9LECA